MSGEHSTENDLDQYPRDLYEAVVSAVPMWIRHRMMDVSSQGGVQTETDLLSAIEDVVHLTLNKISQELLLLLSTDVDDQRLNPLHVIRQANVFANRALEAAGVPAPQRDEFDVRAMPEDTYAIGPATWRDLSDEVHDAGITWGAWKAAMVMTRRRAEGKIT